MTGIFLLGVLVGIVVGYLARSLMPYITFLFMVNEMERARRRRIRESIDEIERRVNSEELQ